MLLEVPLKPARLILDAGTRSHAAQLSQARARAHGTRKVALHATDAHRLAACKTLEIRIHQGVVCKRARSGFVDTAAVRIVKRKP